MTDLTTGKAAEVIGVSPNTIRAWERRYGVLSTRKPSGHRLYERDVVFALRDALREGLSGKAAVARAAELRSPADDRHSILIKRVRAYAPHPTSSLVTEAAECSCGWRDREPRSDGSYESLYRGQSISARVAFHRQLVVEAALGLRFIVRYER